MAIQGDIRDLDLSLLIGTASFRKGVVEISCPPLDSVRIYFGSGMILSVVRNGEVLGNILEVLDTLISVMRCRNGTFVMENLEGTDVEIPRGVSIDVDQATLWVSSLLDEMRHYTLNLPQDVPLRVIPERAKSVKDTLEAAFLLMAMDELVKGATLKELRQRLPLRDDTIEYFVSRLLREGVLEFVKDRKKVKVVVDADDDVKSAVVSVLSSLGYEAEILSNGRRTDAHLYVVDTDGRGFLWANSNYGNLTSRTILVGSSDIRSCRFRYIKKPVDIDALRRAVKEILKDNGNDERD
ncbi:MAG: hypothetical protein GXO29_01480 [Thermotogae bacterium]|nr:hypothetical protein [Thermotogota bacterium]